jgi:hypothetical protein
MSSRFIFGTAPAGSVWGVHKQATVHHTPTVVGRTLQPPYGVVNVSRRLGAARGATASAAWESITSAAARTSRSATARTSGSATAGSTATTTRRTGAGGTPTGGTEAEEIAG